MKKILLCPLVIVCFCFQCYAGAWTKKKNEGFGQISFTHIRSDKLFNNGDSLIQLRRMIGDYTFQGYLEYGITDKITLISVIPYKYVQAEKKIFATNDFSDTLRSGWLRSFGNITIGGKFQLHSKKYVVAALANVETISTFSDNRTGLQSGYNCWAFNPAVLVGRGWKHVYFSTETGVKFRTNNYSHEFFGILEIGASPNGKTYLIGMSELRVSFFNGTYRDGKMLHTGLYVNDQQYFSWGLKLLHTFNSRWVFTLSGFGVFPSAINNLVAHDLSKTIGIAYKWGVK